MKKIVVNSSNCIGCGICYGNDPEHFDINKDGHSYPISQENLDSSELQTAIDSCPVSAISIEEDSEVEEKAA